jgi:hypothetical protein
MGMVATTVAIKPDPMPRCCAKPTKFMATNTINPPTPAECNHSRGVGHGCWCQRAKPSMMVPASKKRLPFMNHGGMVFNATDKPK